MRKLAYIFSLLFITFSANAHEFDVISGISVETDYTKNGAKGINITYRYNFLSIEEYNHDDSILKNASFSIKTTFSENGNDIEASEGYNSVSNDNGIAEFTTTFTLSEMEASKFDKKIYQFIPYAVLKLPEGKHTITVNAFFSGKDGNEKYYEQTKEEKDISFKKPLTKIFTLNIDYIELNAKNSKGNAWDFVLFGTDAPDIGVEVLMGTTSIYNNYVDNNYMYSVGSKSKNISFLISENDNVNILVQDIDVLFHDLVAKWSFSTKKLKDGQVYIFDKTNSNIKSCSLNYKID